MTARKLNQRETLALLDVLIEDVPKDGRAAPATFRLRLQALRELINRLGHAEPTLADVHASLFPGLKAASRRTTFSTFRSELATAAKATGRSLALVQPPVRGKSASQIVLHFDGVPRSSGGRINAVARSVIAGEGRQSSIDAPAAFFSGETYRRLVEMFSDPGNPARLPVRYFLSYAHKDDALTRKLLNRLQDELAISSRFEFHIWQDKRIPVGRDWHHDIGRALAECDLCLSLLSPAFFASNYIRQHEIPPVVENRIAAGPVLLEPLDFERQNLQGIEKLQIFSLEANGVCRAFSECRGEVAKRFAHELASRIVERVQELTHELILRFCADYQTGDAARLAMVGKHPQLQELLDGMEIDLPARPRPSGSTRKPNIRDNIAKERLTPLLEACIRQLPRTTIEAFAASGDLAALTSELNKGGDRENSLREQQQKAVDRLRCWVADPESPPFAAVLGEIGSGKTTTLRMLARALIRDPDMPPVIFIDLREYVAEGPPRLEGILEEHLRRHDADGKLTVDELIASVRSERALIIFDGLDEKIIGLGEAERQNFIRELWRILPADLMDRSAESGRGRLIISCRSHYFPTVQAQSSGYLANDRGDVRARDYLACIMLPWQDDQISEYLKDLLGEEQADRALRIIESVHNLKDLATRPYLLELIGPEIEGLEQERAAGRPVNAASLYRRFVERWLHRDDGKHVFTPVHKLRLMEALAADLWRDNAREMSWQRVEEWLETFLYENPVIARAVEGRPVTTLHQDFRTATFFLRPATAGESFRFAHTSLQEYFLACHLARVLQGGRNAGASPGAAWDLPMPSLEAFDFLGQLLQCSTDRERREALARLGALVADPAAPGTARLNALRYHLRAQQQALPDLDQPDVALAGLDLEGWEFHGTDERPLEFGRVDFTAATLVRASFENVHFRQGGSFRKADIRGAEFIDCHMGAADFREARMEAAVPFFRNCDLREATFDSPLEGSALVHSSAVLRRLEERSNRATKPTAVAPTGHSFIVVSVAFSKDGQLALSGSYDNGLRVWDTRSGKCLKAMTGIEQVVHSVDFSHHSSRLCSSASGHDLLIWDVQTGKCVSTLSGHTKLVSSVAFCPDGERLISGSFDNLIRIWDVRSGKCINTLAGHRDAVRCVRFSSDGMLAVSASKDRTLRLWDATTGQCMRTFTGHREAITSVAFSPDGRLLVSGSDARLVRSRARDQWYTSSPSGDNLRIWEVESGRCISELKGHGDSIAAVVFSPDGDWVVSGSYDQSIRVWNVSSGKCARVLTGHTDSVQSLAFAPGCSQLLSGSGDGTLRIWEFFSGKCLRVVKENSEMIMSVTPASNQGRLATVHNDNTLRLWEISSGQCVHVFKGHQHPISSVVFSPNGKLIVSGSGNNTLRVWDASSGDCLNRLTPIEADDDTITAIGFSPEANLLVSGSWKGIIRLWDICSVRCIKSNSGHAPRITTVAFSSDGQQFVSRSEDGTTRVWDSVGDPVDGRDMGKFESALNPDHTHGLTWDYLNSSTIRLRQQGRILRDIIPLPGGNSLVLEPWDEVEAAKPDHEVRMKLVAGPADAWRYCHAVDPETLAILPPEAATETGTWTINWPPGP